MARQEIATNIADKSACHRQCAEQYGTRSRETDGAISDAYLELALAHGRLAKLFAERVKDSEQKGESEHEL